MKRFYFKRLLKCAILFMVCVIVGCEDGDGDGNRSGLFSVNATCQVEFAPGNLAEDGRSFVAHQWENGGYFGWGTGRNPGTKSLNPYDYSRFNDWGDSIAGGWRTLSFEECEYLLHDRPDAEDKTGLAMVNNVHGLILLPDDWTLPIGCTFVAGENGWDNNKYTMEQWWQMEKRGAVFLPATGERKGKNVSNVGDVGGYWLSTSYYGFKACRMYFDEDCILTWWDRDRYDGQSVRLVRNVGIKIGILK